MSDGIIDLYSDTQTKPGEGMRKAMVEAPVGDEQGGQDPTVNKLCETVAELLGKEAAVFLPSGTMGNQISICIHCRPGDEIIADKTTHIMSSEGGGPSALAGAQFHPLDGERGIFTAEQVERAIQPKRLSAPRTGLIEVEQTSNAGGGTVWPLTTLQEINAVADANGIPVHMDGARLLNAVVASNVSAADYAATVDSLWLDLSKGLGCPVGAVLAGSKDFIYEAWRWKKRLGGAMRQAGIIAAAGLYALEHNVDRLAEDHENAKLFGARIAEIPGVDVIPVETNLVFFDVGGAGFKAADVVALLKARGVNIGAKYGSGMRAVTHHDVSRDEVLRAADILREVLTEAKAA